MAEPETIVCRGMSRPRAIATMRARARRLEERERRKAVWREVRVLVISALPALIVLLVIFVVGVKW